MIKVFKTIKTLTSIIFIALLIIAYSYLIEATRVYLNVQKTESMDVEMLFYIGLGIFVFISLVFFIFDRILFSYQQKADQSNFFTSNSFLTWLAGFNIAVNVLLCSFVLFVGFINSDDYYNLLNYTILLYLGPALILISLLALPVLYIKRN